MSKVEINWEEVAEVYDKLAAATAGHGVAVTSIAFGQPLVHQAVDAEKEGRVKYYDVLGGKK